MRVPFALSAENSFFESLSAWYQNSIICEILTYLEEKYFSVSMDAYQNLSVSSNTATNIRNMILAIALGIIIASAMMVYTRRGMGGFIRKMLKSDCTSPENAKTLSELGYYNNFSIRRALKSRVTFGKLVKCKEEEEWAQEESFTHETDQTDVRPPFRLDCSTMHFYIPEDLRYRAEIRFEKKGTSWMFFVIILIGTIIGAALLCWLAPQLLKLTDNLITLLSK